MKVVDTFTFFNELELLEVRLNTLNDHVDKFVLVESTRSHQNKPKPLFYQENKHLFEKFNSKIEHIIVDDFPEHTYHSFEHHQRDCIERGLGCCEDDDIVFISDLDEIWDPAKIDLNIDDEKIYKWGSLLAYFYLNLIAQPNMWWQPLFLKYSLLKSLRAKNFEITRHILRNESRSPEIIFEHLPDLRGWHFSYIGDAEYKLQNFLHSEHRDKKKSYLQQCVKDRVNPFHTSVKMHKLKDVGLDNYLPGYISNNISKYGHLILNE